MELRLAQVDGHALETDRFLVEDTLFDCPALLNSVEVSLFHPDAAGVNRVGVDVLLFERFKSLRLIVHEAVANLFEVVLAAVPVLLEAPPVGATFQFHVAVFTEGLDFVRARDDREFIADLVEVLTGPHVLREGEHACGFPEVAPVRFLGSHLHCKAIDDFGAIKAAEPDLENRREVLLVHDDVVIVLHVFGGHGLAIAPLGARVHVEGERLAVFAHAPAICQDADFAVFGGVQAHQRLEHHAHELGGEAVVVFPHVEGLRHRGAPEGNRPAGAGILRGNRVKLARGRRIKRQFRAIQFGILASRLCPLGTGFVASAKRQRRNHQSRRHKRGTIKLHFFILHFKSRRFLKYSINI